MKKPLVLAFALLTVYPVFAGGQKAAAPESKHAAAPQNNETAKGDLDQQGLSIGVLKPQGENLGGDAWLPSYVQGILIANFSKYSGMNVPDRQNIDAIIEESETSYYGNEEELLRLGQTIKVSYFLTGILSKVSTTQDYSLQLAVTDALTGNQAASSIINAAPEQLLDGTALNLATIELLTQLGAQLTAEAQLALSQPMSVQTAESQTALAKANTARTEFERMQYIYEAAAIDPNLKEAAERLAAYKAALFEIPPFNTTAFTAPTFRLPAIKPVNTGNTASDARNELALYQANQTAIKEQQQTLLQQREELLAQWRDFLRLLDEQHRPIRAQEQALLLRQGELVDLLQQAEAFYAEHPPFRILYNPTAEQYGLIDSKNATLNLRFQIASEPTNIEALFDVVNALLNLNKSFTAVNKAFEDTNTVMAARFSQAQAAMNALENALSATNSAGERYDVAPIFADWTLPPGDKVNGTELTITWPVNYPCSFTITASLLNDAGNTIGRGSASLANEVEWNGPLEPETASAWCEFNNVNINDITDTLTVRIDTVNGRDAETAAMTGYIAIDADGARTPVIGRQVAARWPWRTYWSNPAYFNSLGLAIGTTGNLVSPAFLVSAKLTFSLFAHTFFEAGSDFGLAHGEWDVKGVQYLSIAPYLHVNAFQAQPPLGIYVGIGGGANLSRYTYPSESRIDPVTVNTWVLDVAAGLLCMFTHSVIDIRWTLKTNFKGVDSRFTLGYSYRFGYVATRYGGEPAHLTKQR